MKGDRVRYLSAGIFYDDSNWFARSELIGVQFDDSIIPNQKLGYFSIGHHVGDITLHFTHARKKMKPNGGNAGPINTLKDQIVLAGYGSSSAALGLQDLSDGVTQVEGALVNSIKSTIVGLRYSLSESLALKIESQYSKNQIEQKARLFSFGIDFVF